MNNNIEKLYELMSNLDKISRHGNTGYEVNKTLNISEKAINLIQKLDDLDNEIKKEVITGLQFILKSKVSTSNKDEILDIIRIATSSIINVLAFYGINFY